MRRCRPFVLAWFVCLVTGSTAAGQSLPPPFDLGDSTLRVLIARHGETAANAERRIVGQMDVPLNARGREQSLRLRDTLRGVVIDAIYASPLTRSLTTAQTVADGRTVRVLPTLVERNQGAYQGQLVSDRFSQRSLDPTDDLDGGETMLQVRRRATAALELMRKAHPRGTIVVVGHALLNQMLLASIIGLSTENAMKIGQANDEVYLAEVSDRRPPSLWKLISPTSFGEL